MCLLTLSCSGLQKIKLNGGSFHSLGRRFIIRRNAQTCVKLPKRAIVSLESDLQV